MGCCRCGGKKEELSVERDKCVRERETCCRKQLRRRLVFFFFGLDFLLSQVINGASIYRQWKRVISSTPG